MKEEKYPKQHHDGKPPVRRSFLLWVGKYNPDFVSRRVLGLLIEKYGMGEKEALFAKMKQLECDEHYELCTMFKSMFDSMNLNKEYLRWAKKLRLTFCRLPKGVILTTKLNTKI